MLERIIARLRFEYCLGRNTVPCTGRQMRNGFFTLNMIVWIVIVIFAFRLIA
jgi:hypothetical protein